MAIEEHFSNTLNIKNFMTETPERSELSFDSVREIGEEDWKLMKISLLNDRSQDEHGDWWDFSRGAADLVILFPDKSDELNIDQTAIRGMTGQARNYMEREDHDNFYWEMRNLKIATKKNGQELELGNEIMTQMKMKVDRYKEINNWSGFVDMAYNVRILFPQREGILNLDDAVWNSVKNYLAEHRQNNTNNFANYYHIMAKIKIIFPEKFKEILPSPADWRFMRGQLSDHRDRHQWSLFSSQAATMKILAAEKVEVTEKGLEVVMSAGNSLRQDSPMPEARKF